MPLPHNTLVRLISAINDGEYDVAEDLFDSNAKLFVSSKPHNHEYLMPADYVAYYRKKRKVGGISKLILERFIDDEEPQCEIPGGNGPRVDRDHRTRKKKYDTAITWVTLVQKQNRKERGGNLVERWWFDEKGWILARKPQKATTLIGPYMAMSEGLDAPGGIIFYEEDKSKGGIPALTRGEADAVRAEEDPRAGQEIRLDPGAPDVPTSLEDIVANERAQRRSERENREARRNHETRHRPDMTSAFQLPRSREGRPF
ncbi:hypothetical protein TWF694_006340 [Orbilia ellipsospora]|uniref:Uncharacterized protein n=1 Tax=Orbilia ellipsospora TaxID=2528407 RepID=A0AAV9XME0_9PEZI